MFKIRLVMLALFLGGGLCSAEEQITITTYYPAPNGLYREIRSQRMAIGDNYYSSAYCWGVGCGTNVIDANTDLVVEGRVGIGTVTPISALDVGTGVISARQAYFNSDGAVGNEAMVGIGTNTIPAHPSGIGHGLLSVYDVFLRGATPPRWASEGNFGTPIGRVNNTVYQASTDGFVNAFSTKDGASVRAFTDPNINLVTSSDGTVEWGRHTKGGEGGVLMPVRKGNYWKVSITEEPNIRWLPSGN